MQDDLPRKKRLAVAQKIDTTLSGGYGYLLMIHDLQCFLKRPLFIKKSSIFLSSPTSKIQCWSSATVVSWQDILLTQKTGKNQQEFETVLLSINLRSLLNQLSHDGGTYHIESSPLICIAKQWNGFYMTRIFIECLLQKYIFLELSDVQALQQ